jgi:DNA-binding transcriptional LysR family regulator
LVQYDETDEGGEHRVHAHEDAEELRRHPAQREQVDDWLAAIAAGRCVGLTPHATVTQYRRDGIVYRPVRDAPPVDVYLIWARLDPHPATQAAVSLLTELYRTPRATAAGPSRTTGSP